MKLILLFIIGMLLIYYNQNGVLAIAGLTISGPIILYWLALSVNANAESSRND